jgi:hypothetical protein
VRLDSAPLTGLAGAAGIDLADLQLGDSRKTFQRSPRVGTSQLAAIPWSAFSTVLDGYGDALQLALDYEDIPVTIDASMDSASWDQIRSTLEPTGQYRLRIGIDKARLLDLNGLSDRNICHFFFTSQLLALLDESPPRIEAEIWDTADAPALILAGDATVDLAGPLLRVIGGARLDSAAVPAAQVPPNVIAALREARRENVSVDAAAIGDLTPWHVRTVPAVPCSGASEEIRTRLAAQHAQLCLLSLCDRARSCGTTATATSVEFRSTERLVSVTADTSGACLRAVTDTQADALMSVVSWCYEDVLHPAARNWTAQRIQFVQVRIALLAGAAPDADQPAAVLRAITDVDTVKVVFWKSFLENAVSDYLDRLRELDDVIDKTADAYGEQASGITNTLTTSVLAAVGVFIGSIIAAAFSKPFNADLFRAGVWAYTAYLAIFPAGLGLSVQASRYRDLHTRFERRRSDYESLLGEDHVSQRIGARITDARGRWKLFFATAAILYAIIVIVALIGGAQLPQIIKAPAVVTANHPSPSPQPDEQVPNRTSSATLPSPHTLEPARPRGQRVSIRAVTPGEAVALACQLCPPSPGTAGQVYRAGTASRDHPGTHYGTRFDESHSRARPGWAPIGQTTHRLRIRRVHQRNTKGVPEVPGKYMTAAAVRLAARQRQPGRGQSRPASLPGSGGVVVRCDPAPLSAPLVLARISVAAHPRAQELIRRPRSRGTAIRARPEVGLRLKLASGLSVELCQALFEFVGAGQDHGVDKVERTDCER